MTDDTAATFNLDDLSDKTARDVLRRAAAEARNGPVWITEGGQRIAAIVSIPYASAVRRYIGDLEKLAPLLAAHAEDVARYGTGCGSEILRQKEAERTGAHVQPHFGEDGTCQCPRPCCADGETCLCLECSCEPRNHREQS